MSNLVGIFSIGNINPRIHCSLHFHVLRRSRIRFLLDKAKLGNAFIVSHFNCAPVMWVDINLYNEKLFLLEFNFLGQIIFRIIS